MGGRPQQVNGEGVDALTDFGRCRLAIRRRACSLYQQQSDDGEPTTGGLPETKWHHFAFFQSHCQSPPLVKDLCERGEQGCALADVEAFQIGAVEMAVLGAGCAGGWAWIGD